MQPRGSQWFTGLSRFTHGPSRGMLWGTPAMLEIFPKACILQAHKDTDRP